MPRNYILTCRSQRHCDKTLFRPNLQPEMLRKLPPTITADQTPDWLPVGWITHSTVLKRGRQTRTYTHLRTRKKFSSKDQVLEYAKMDKVREERASEIEKKKANIYENMLNGLKTHSKQEVILYHNSMESEASLRKSIEETEIDYISYDYDMDEEDWSGNEYVENEGSRADVENFSNITSTSLRSLPVRMQKLESRAKTQCVFDDEDMSSDSDEIISEAEAEASKEEGCKEENTVEEVQVVSHKVESFEEENLHDVVVECADKMREIPDFTGSFSIENNLECESGSDSLEDKDLSKIETEGIGTHNTEIREQESDLMHISASSKVVGVTQETGEKSEEPLKDQATQEETGNESRRSVFFPNRKAPSHSVLVFDNSSADGLINTIELGLNPCADTPQEENICGSKKQKKNAKPRSSKNIKKKDTEAQTTKIQKGKRTPRKPKGDKGSLSVTTEKKPVDWPEPCPNFPFEPLTSSFQVEDDSVIRRYLDQHFEASESADSNNIPLPDFGLPSFSNIKISLKEEPESKKKKSPDPPCVEFANSSLPSCSSMGTSMKQTVAGN